MTKVENTGYSIQAANKTTIKNLNKVWRKLESIGLTMGKTKPEVRNFTGVAQNGSVLSYPDQLHLRTVRLLIFGFQGFFPCFE